MNTSQRSVPQLTLETVAKSFFKQTITYGFQQLDYVRFVNILLDLSFNSDQTDLKVGEMRIAA